MAMNVIAVDESEAHPSRIQMIGVDVVAITTILRKGHRIEIFIAVKGPEAQRLLDQLLANCQ